VKDTAKLINKIEKSFRIFCYQQQNLRMISAFNVRIANPLKPLKNFPQLAE
jgi:hypothetical protein